MKSLWWVAIFGIPFHARDTDVIAQMIAHFGVLRGVKCQWEDMEEMIYRSKWYSLRLIAWYATLMF